ncbi:MAG: FtsW/RodA/SpoVE family cell cycle protein, partial [Methylobacter sp.]
MKILRARGGRFYFDSVLLIVSTSLLLIGYVMVASASLHLGIKMTGNGLYYPVRQLVHIGLGLIFGGIVAAVPMRFWEENGPRLFLAGLLLLIIVLIPGLGVKVNGSVRWLSIAGM